MKRTFKILCAACGRLLGGSDDADITVYRTCADCYITQTHQPTEVVETIWGKFVVGGES